MRLAAPPVAARPLRRAGRTAARRSLVGEVRVALSPAAPGRRLAALAPVQQVQQVQQVRQLWQVLRAITARVARQVVPEDRAAAALPSYVRRRYSTRGTRHRV
jgi:hypothetical protein